MLEKVIVFALFVNFVVLLLTKTGARDFLRDEADSAGLSVVAKAIDCDFCFCWWLSLFFSISLVLVSGDASYLALAILSTPIARVLI